MASTLTLKGDCNMCLDKLTAERLYDSGKKKTVEFLLRLDAK
jgi:hypothetical protein